ncbi:leucine-rich repeat-domain-containing protein [Melampsora americana]|nr:leucine-rich repeat-domain-containing protein [Melampsora americana]
MPRMTPELLLSTHSYLNPLKDRELDLRGFQIPAIENLAVTKDSIDSLDLTDNIIRSVINLPKLNRLKHLYLSNNPITFISPNLSQSLPNLRSLVLSNCQLTNFNQLFKILSQFKHLEFLILNGNPITKMSFYRDWCIYSCKKLRMLDHRRIKDQERKTSLELFYDPSTKLPTDLAKSLLILDIQTENTALQMDYQQKDQHLPGQMGKTLTDEERDRIKLAIEKAETVEEVRRLKRMLEQGFVPKGAKENQVEVEVEKEPELEDQMVVDEKEEVVVVKPTKTTKKTTKATGAKKGRAKK